MTDWKRVKTGVGGSQKGKTYFYEIFIKIACLFKFLYLHLQNVKHTLQYLPDKLFKTSYYEKKFTIFNDYSYFVCNHVVSARMEQYAG